MNNKPIIGIVSKPNKFDIKLFHSPRVYEPLRCAVLKNGGLAIGILPTQDTDNFYEDEVKIDNTILTDLEKNDLHSLIDICDGIILEGGLSSASYEYEVAKYAIDKNIPLLGICAGFNNIIRAMDDKIFQDKDNIRHNREDGKIAHKNMIVENTLLFSILNNNEVEVNSLHTFFAKTENINNLEISAYSDDGYVEAVELKDKKFCLGVKWHPELMVDNECMNNIFKYFIEVCKRK